MHPTHSAVLPEDGCGIKAGACWVGILTSVWGSGGSDSAFFSASSSSLGLGNLAAASQTMLPLLDTQAQGGLQTYKTPYGWRAAHCASSKALPRRLDANTSTSDSAATWCPSCPSTRRLSTVQMSDHSPSVPSDKVLSLSPSICIWSASPALSACSSLRLANSAFFSAMRARRTGDWAEGCEPPREPDWLRR